MAATDPDITQAARLLRDGGVVAFPTETVYGLGASALNPAAVARVFAIKARPRFDPLIVHLAAAADADRLAAAIPDAAQRLMSRFWPGPLTLVLPKRANVPDLVTAELPTVALRVPAHPMALALLEACALPIAAPSANPFGRLSPTTAAHVRATLGDQVDLILDGGSCTTGVESTVVSFTDDQGRLRDQPLILRPGGTPVELIEAELGRPLLRPAVETVDPAKQAQSPGQLAQHYAPRTPLVLLPPGVKKTGQVQLFLRPTPPPPDNNWTCPVFSGRCGLLAWTAPPAEIAAQFAAVEVLAPDAGDEAAQLQQAAVRLFAALHRLDGLGLDRIVAQRVPAGGLGLAINDRLTRAAHASPQP